MRDENLVGRWDTGPYDYGVMESGWLALRGDGTGWSAWANVGGGSVSRLTWSSCGDAGTGVLELRYTWTATGDWSPGTPPTLTRVDEEGPDDTVLCTRYTVSVRTPPLAQAPATTLHLAKAVECAHDFALVTREVEPSDPAGR
ncbi:hypothetical protein [Micromonospora cathayae]|uniref:Activator of Hsp90 ATPase homolog 1-like protein n=1 Tax=Micromonospora cathayae TaxID=3028804 RepID=A0ABY7ZJU0_9ACTN|nr:hypothetical protein [Micromonospora sp. HUAS 3]WDZ82179.1 hypothetical protein PVK37_16860 [Micromonospora sp. HUAS 3]